MSTYKPRDTPPSGPPPGPRQREQLTPLPTTNINDRIKTALGEKYVPESHSISNPGFVFDPAKHTPNDAVNTANNYISVAQNISKIDPYRKLLGVKSAVNAISIAAETFNAAIGARNSGTRKAIVIPKILGGGKRKRNKKIGTKKKLYKRK